MARRSRRNRDPLDLLLPLFGLVLLCALFAPNVLRGVVSAGLLVAAGAGVIGVVGSVVWLIRQYRQPEPDWFAGSRKTTPTAPSTPMPAANAEVRARPMCTETSTCSLELLRTLEWKRFEDVVAAYFRWEGLRAKTTRIGPDGGVDVYLFRDGESAPLAVVQCKAWNSYKVGIKPVRELLGVMASEKVAKGYFITTGVFTEEALEFARTNPLTLIDGQELLRRVEALPEGARRQLLEMATAGDYTTPTCPRCGVKMVRRTARSGSNPGSEFWGCPAYPRCKGVLKMHAA
jgi:restriction system protein